MFSSTLSGFGGFGGLSSGIIQGDQELAGGGFFGSLPAEIKPISNKPKPKPVVPDLFESIVRSSKPAQPAPSSAKDDSVFDSIIGRVGVFMPVKDVDTNGTSSGGAVLPPSNRDDSLTADPNKKHIMHGALAGGATVLVMKVLANRSLSMSLVSGVAVGSATYLVMRE